MIMESDVFVMQSLVGPVAVTVQGDSVVSLRYLFGKPVRFSNDAELGKPARAIRQRLAAYFQDASAGSMHPDIKVTFNTGTAYQRRVWQALCNIKVGQTISYGKLAEQLDSGARAVANACRMNPVPVIVPCHRVVAQSGPGGYHGATSGHFMTIKTRLLAHEGVTVYS